MLALALVVLTPPPPVRAELVEARAPAKRLSTSSGRTEDDIIEAERAFAADALALGQWTAFRKWADPDAIMFVPEMVTAQTWLASRKDPQISVRWQPAASFVSCDGDMAVTTGAWQGADKSQGYFTTIWGRQRGQWRWQLDHGDTLAAPRPAPREPAERRASCTKPVPVSPPFVTPSGDKSGFGNSPDDTLRVRFSADPFGARRVTVLLWNGSDFDIVVDDRVAAPTRRKP